MPFTMFVQASFFSDGIPSPKQLDGQIAKIRIFFDAVRDVHSHVRFAQLLDRGVEIVEKTVRTQVWRTDE